MTRHRVASLKTTSDRRLRSVVSSLHFYGIVSAPDRVLLRCFYSLLENLRAWNHNSPLFSIFTCYLLSVTMPPVRTAARNRKPPPAGFDDIEDTLLEFGNKMKDAENASHEGKKKHEVLWPIFQISHQRK